MAAISKPLAHTTHTDQLRPFDAGRDMAQVADLIELCFAGVLDQDGKFFIQQMRDFSRNPTLLRWAPLSAEWTGSPFIGYVWEHNNQVIGNISLIPYKLQGKRHYLIANVAVHPDYRRQGIAHKLTQHAINHVRARNAADVWLHVRENNQTAIKLYQELGFSERARRTTWHSQPGSPIHVTSEDLQIVSRRASHWSSQKIWLQRSYPPELSWHLSINWRVLQPGLWGTLNRLFSVTAIQQWSAMRKGKLQAVLAYQASSSHAIPIWLAAPQGCDEEPLKLLLLYARRHASPRHTLVLDYPARQFHEIIRTAGFKEKQTLIWMQMKINT